MKLNKIIITGFTALFCLAASAQKISFDKETINNGSTAWKQPVTATFKFTNKGKLPLVIKSIDAGCGCLTPSWTKGQIEKGQSGEIQITYDAMQLGHYDRYIDVFTNASDEPEQIRLRGVISSGNRKTFEDEYPLCIDNIYLNATSVEFKEVSKRDSTKAYIEVYNASKDVYTPTLMHLPSYITAKAEPEMLARGRKGKIELTLHGDKLNDLGLNQTNIYVARYAGDTVGKNNEINVTAILLPDQVNESMQAQKPAFEISTKELNLGKLGKKKKLTGTVIIKNNGSAHLRIDRVQAFNPAIMVNLPESDIFPGESVKMQITVQAKYLGMSKAQPRVLLITNDPNHPMEVLTVLYE